MRLNEPVAAHRRLFRVALGGRVHAALLALHAPPPPISSAIGTSTTARSTVDFANAASYAIASRHRSDAGGGRTGWNGVSVIAPGSKAIHLTADRVNDVPVHLEPVRVVEGPHDPRTIRSAGPSLPAE